MFANQNPQPIDNFSDNIFIGIIGSVDFANATAIVQLGDIETPPLKWLERTGHLKTWLPPIVGEQVLIAAPNGDLANAFICGGIDFASNPAIGNSENPKIKCGSFELNVNFQSGEVTINAPKITINGDLNVIGKIDASGIIKSENDVMAQNVALKTHKHLLVKAGTDKSGGPE